MLFRSMPDAMALAIQTPVGVILHTGDFKFDQSPVDGKTTDFARLNHYGEQGVRVLLSDSTNSERTGFTPSESSLRLPLEEIFLRARKKIVASCFASSLHRIQLFLDLAREFDRKVALVGRSMSNAVQIGTSLGYLRAEEGLIVSPADRKSVV